MVHGIKHFYYEKQLASTLLMRFKSEARIAVKIAATLSDPSSFSEVVSPLVVGDLRVPRGCRNDYQLSLVV